MRFALVLLVVAFIPTIASQSAAQTEVTLHDFDPDGRGGLSPTASVITDAAGNLYGTTQFGGYENAGIVFELIRQRDGHWAEQVLHNFSQVGIDGDQPAASLVFDAVGNLYGTTQYGGSGACPSNGAYPPGCGTVFELMPQSDGTWREKILHQFSMNPADGRYPHANLIGYQC